MLVLRMVLSMGLLCGGLVGQVANHRNGELMSNDQWPDTDDVRAVFTGYPETVEEGPIITPQQAGAEFDRWLAKHDRETFDRGWVAGAEEVLRGIWPPH
jgi:hypothetical protein